MLAGPLEAPLAFSTQNLHDLPLPKLYIHFKDPSSLGRKIVPSVQPYKSDSIDRRIKIIQNMEEYRNG